VIGRLASVATLFIAVGATLALSLGPKVKQKPKPPLPAGEILAIAPSGGAPIAGLYSGDGADQTRYTNPPSTPLAGRQVLAVTMRRISFTPETIQVHAGDAVQWSNNDNVVHTVTASTDPVTGAAGPFASPLLAPGQRFTLRFAHRGTFGYYCSIHPTMVGTVVVVS
jgi:plastocyanin